MWGLSSWGRFTWGPLVPAFCTCRASCSVVTKVRSRAMVIGNVVQLDFQVLGVSGWVDPTAVTLTLKPPTGANFSPVPARLGVGRYQSLLPTTGLLTGLWHYRWEGTSPYQCAAEGEFEILASEVL